VLYKLNNLATVTSFLLKQPLKHSVQRRGETIQYLRQTQNYSAKRFLMKFPDKRWKLDGLTYLLRKIDKTDSCVRWANGVQQAAISQLRARLTACVAAEGEHFYKL